MFQYARLLNPRHDIDRRGFVLWGVGLFVLKFLLDRLVAKAAFSREWSIQDYLIPTKSLGLLALPPDERLFYASMVAIALPFIWIGVCLTLQRQSAAGIGAGWVVLFFVPIVNLLYFLALSIAPSRNKTEHPRHPARIAGLSSNSNDLSDAPILNYGRPRYGRLQMLVFRIWPEQTFRSGLLAIALTAPTGAILTIFGAEVLGHYGWGIFVGIPFAVAFCSSLLFCLRDAQSMFACIRVSFLALLVWTGMLLLTGYEGVMCLVMAAPLAFLVALIGAMAGYSMQACFHGEQAMTVIVLLMICLPGLMAAESLDHCPPDLIAVESTVEIAAPPDVVWKSVVQFPKLEKPAEWLFRTGIAYPTEAQIDGCGIGATRRCIFSTGTFVEPIDVWDPPHTLAFGVESQPAPLREWSLGSEPHPPHLNGYLVSKRGQFQLTPLAGGGTRLKGTTWYINRMWPQWYWQTWSDHIIHTIHLRVLNHVKRIAESTERP